MIIYKEKQSDDDDAEIIVKIFVEFTVGTGKIAKRLGTEHFYNVSLFYVDSGAETARDSLNGRFFAGRMVRCDIYDQALYECNDLSG